MLLPEAASAIDVATTHSVNFASSTILAAIWLMDNPTVNIGSITISLNMRGSGTNNSAHTAASLIKCTPNALVIDHGSSTFAFKNPEKIFHANHIADNAAAKGIITPPIALYAFGNKFDIVAITLPNISHDQHVEKKDKASDIFTGDTVLNTENPAIPIAPAIPPTTKGAIAPADNGRNDKNIIQNFFKRPIAFNYITFSPKCDIIENNKYICV